jgi:DNA repair exonuclease SbcCD ATPase subunit
MYEKKNKTPIKYICPHCSKDFGNHKYHYEIHLNKKKSCVKIEKINDLNYEKLNISNNNDNQNNLMLNLMDKMNYLIKQNEEFKQQNEEIKKQNEEFKEEIKVLKEQITTKPLVSNVSGNNNINSNNVNININNYNTMDYSKIDPKQLINTILQNTGKQIYLKAIENIFVNPEKPENHNLYIADKNRQYVKKYNDGRWNTDNFNIIDTLINNFIDYYKLSPLKILNFHLIF